MMATPGNGAAATGWRRELVQTRKGGGVFIETLAPARAPTGGGGDVHDGAARLCAQMVLVTETANQRWQAVGEQRVATWRCL